MTPGNPGMGRGWTGSQRDSELLHEYMSEAFAKGLDLTPEVLESRLAAGDTIAAIASGRDIDLEGFRALWLEARFQAIRAAMADGVITAEQADRMLQRMRMAGSTGGSAQWGCSGPRRRGSRGRMGMQTRGALPAQP